MLAPPGWLSRMSEASARSPLVDKSSCGLYDGLPNITAVQSICMIFSLCMVNTWPALSMQVLRLTLAGDQIRGGLLRWDWGGTVRSLCMAGRAPYETPITEIAGECCRTPLEQALQGW